VNFVRRIVVLVLLIAPFVTGPVLAADDDRPLTPPSPIPAGDAAKPLLARWLHEGSNVEAAWAAWEAGERALEDFGPAVAARLGKEVRKPGSQRRSLLEMLLMDAAIRLGAEVPGETLRRRGFTTAGVVTYLCSREASPLHVNAFDSMDDGWSAGSTAWFAVGGHLHAARMQAFARRLMLKWRLERMLRVWDTDGPWPAYGRPSGSVPGDGWERIPEAYPPIPRRWISLRKSERWSRLVGGPFPVYGTRSVDKGKLIGWPTTGGRRAPDVARRVWLLDWLGGAKVPDLPQWSVVDVKWSGGRQPWERQVRAVVTDINDRWRAWRDALVVRGLLTADRCAGLVPRVKWSVQDKRRLRRRPVPPMPEIVFDPRVPGGARGRSGHRGK